MRGSEWMQLVFVSPLPHYWLLLCIFSFLGAIHSPFFFLAHLLDFLRALPFSSLARVWARAWRPLLRTTAVALIILTSLALYAYTFFYSAMNSSGRQCRSPWQCVSSFMIAALSNDVAILGAGDMEEDPDGLVASPLSIEADAWEQFRALYVVTVLVVWGFLLQGAILAQIVEAFASLRADEALLLREEERTCPLCRGARHEPQPQPGAERGRPEAEGAVFKCTLCEAGASAGNVHAPLAYVLYTLTVCARPLASLSPLERHVRESFWGRVPGRFLPLHTSAL